MGGCWIWPKPEQALRVKWEDRETLRSTHRCRGSDSPLEKGAVPKGAGVVLRDGKAKEMDTEIRGAEVRFSAVCKTTPQAATRHRRAAATPFD